MITLIELSALVSLCDIFLRLPYAKFCRRRAGADIKALDVVISYKYRCPRLGTFNDHNSATIIIFKCGRLAVAVLQRGFRAAGSDNWPRI